MIDAAPRVLGRGGEFGHVLGFDIHSDTQRRRTRTDSMQAVRKKYPVIAQAMFPATSRQENTYIATALSGLRVD